MRAMVLASPGTPLEWMELFDRSPGPDETIAVAAIFSREAPLDAVQSPATDARENAYLMPDLRMSPAFGLWQC
jgi:hypothetical protein